MFAVTVSLLAPTSGAPRERQAPSGSHVLVRVCLICNRPMAPYQRTVYLDSGAVVHVPCRRAFHGAATTSMAVIRPSSQALRLRARERRGADALYTDIQ